jgi:uncharacterized membrane protein
MGFILKIFAVLTSLATTVLLTVASVRSGLLVVATIFGLIKIIIIALFCALLLLILYLLVSANKKSSAQSQANP